jgi:hypothetical protein
MSISTLHSTVLEDYRDFVRPLFRVADARLRKSSHGVRAELNTWLARGYGLTRDELPYILDPAGVYGPDFPGEPFCVLKEKKLAKFGEYRTRRLVLEAWDKLP